MNTLALGCKHLVWEAREMAQLHGGTLDVEDSWASRGTVKETKARSGAGWLPTGGVLQGGGRLSRR